tara:strand:- start:5989 stop:7650 length:1662 start_codon:yes stop_codon:yes gene_type:complete
MKGAEFLTKESNHQIVFTYEDFTEEEVMMYKATKDFIQHEILANMQKIEKQEGTIVKDILKKAGEIGLLGVSVPQELGGLGMNFNTSMLIADIIGIAGSFGTTYGAHTGIGTLPILYYGTKEQKEKYIPGLATGELIGCYCLTEPTAGSDANSGKTSAKLSKDKKHYLLTGQKIWISNGGFADIHIVFAKIDDDKNHSAFIVHGSSKGISMSPEEDKLGIKGSSTRQIFYENVKVPIENLLGERNGGFGIALNILNIGRIKLCASAIGGAKLLIEQTKEYIAERKQFGMPINQFGAIKQKLARMVARTFASESLMYRAGQDIENRSKEVGVIDATSEYAIECAIAKVHGSEVIDYVADEAVQCHGGMGYSAEYPIERAYRDSRIARIYEGTNEINRLMLIGQLLKKIRKKQIDIKGLVKQSYFATLSFSSNKGMKLVKNHKVLLGRLIYEAYRKIGKNLVQPTNQQLLMSLADILIEIYATESAILRAQKTGKAKQAQLAMYYQYESNQKVRKFATEIADELDAGVFLNVVINNLTHMETLKPYKLSNNIFDI